MQADRSWWARAKTIAMLPETFQNESKTARILVTGVRNVLDQLPRPLFRIGIDEEIAVQRLLFGVRPGNQPVRDVLADLLACIGPVVCKSPEQQSIFKAIAARQARAAADGLQDARRPVPPSVTSIVEPAPSPASAPLAGDPEADRAVEQQAREIKRSTLHIIIIAVLLGIGLAFIAFMAVPRSPSSTVTVTPEGKKSTSPAIDLTARWSSLKDLVGKGFVVSQDAGFIGRLILAFLPLVAAGLVIAHRRRLTRYLERGRTGALPTKEDAIRVSGSAPGIFGTGTRGRLLSLRTRLERPTGRLNIPATLRATIVSGGRFELKFATRSLSSEYLVLSRKLTDQAHLYHIGAALAAVMRKQEMHVRHYTFWREGVRLVEVRDFGGDGAPDRNIQELTSLQARFPDHRLIVLDEARHLIGRRGGIASWAEELRAWPEKIWLTPVDRSRWGAGEAAAQALGFELVSLADPDPLASLGSAFAGVTELFEPDLSPGEEGVYPRSLYRRSDEFTTLDPPCGEAVTTLMEELKTYLGAAAHRWLQACAVFPVLSPQLTTHLGMQLKGDDHGSRLFTLQGLAALSRLPWFKTGEMPDWLREALVNEMPDPWRERVRETVIQILAPTEAAEGRPSIEVIRRYRRRLVDAIADKLRAQPPSDQIRSRLLVDFLYQRRILSFGLPLWLFRGWREVFTPDALAIGGLGLLAALLTFTLYTPFAQGLDGWMEPLLAWLGQTRTTMILDAINLFGLYLLFTWSKDVVQGRDARAKAQRKVLVFCGFELVATLFPVLIWVCQSAYVTPVDNSLQYPRVISFPETNMLLLTILVGLCAAFLRAAVAPSLPKRIAAVPLAEAIGRTSFFRLLGYFARALVLGGSVGGLFGVLASQHAFGDLMQVDWTYLFAMSGLSGKRFFPVLRPILALPVVALAFGTTLKPLLGRWRTVFELVVAVFLGALIAEAVMVRIQLAGVQAGGGIWLPAILVATLAATALALALIRRQEAGRRQWLWFGVAAALSGTVLVSISFALGSIIRDFSLGFFISASLMMPLLMALASFIDLRVEGFRLPFLRALGHGLSILGLAYLLMSILGLGLLSLVFSINETLAFFILTFTVGCCTWFSILVWLKLTLAPPRISSASWPTVPATVPWLLVPVLLAITFRVLLTDILTIDLSGLFLPLAVFMGLRYRRTGFTAFAAGAWPLLIGYNAGPVSNMNLTSYFLGCLVFCLAAGNRDWLARQMERLGRGRRGILALLLVLPVYFDWNFNAGWVGYSGLDLLVLIVFVCGVVRRDAYRLMIVLSIVALVAKTAYLVDLPLRFATYTFSIGYGLDSLYDILSLWVAVWLGRRVGDGVAGYGAFDVVPSAPVQPKAGTFSSPQGEWLVLVLATLGARAHSRGRNVWRVLMSGPDGVLPRPLAPMFAAHLLFCAILFLAYQGISLGVAAGSWGKDFHGIGAMFIVATLAANLAAILAGAVLGRWSLLTIFLVGAFITFLEPLLLTSPETTIWQSAGVTLSIKVQPLHDVCEFLSCLGCAWLGIYLARTARSAAMTAESKSMRKNKNQSK
ncbi:hypothetical protein DSCO28_62490 [Desulfosarcina ovata subsp. sediminis]|uniref:Uncharacterized protein n=1 Tax=Desulfosarcina ovata subsp. sediminis TaxID=885957 RepID=A0A5K7ZZK7_9BACT|nr:hypothetical protein DSCO28_62490 [Desulfosarcina ovata subsp. sediminis]